MPSLLLFGLLQESQTEPSPLAPCSPLRDELLKSKHYLFGIQFNLKIVLSCHIY